MHFTREEYIQSVNNIFDARPWNVIVSDVDLSMVYEDEYEAEVDYTPPPVLWDCYGIAGEFVGRENPMDDLITDRLRNKPRFTRDMMDEPEKYIGRDVHTTLFTAQIAVLIAKRGKLTLVNHKDAIEISNDIDKYLRIVSDKIVNEPHFKPPPQEDINILNNLVSVLEPLVGPLRRNAQGTGGFEALMRKMDRIGNATAADAMVSVEINGQAGTTEMSYSNGGGLYDF